MQTLKKQLFWQQNIRVLYHRSLTDQRHCLRINHLFHPGVFSIFPCINQHSLLYVTCIDLWLAFFPKPKPTVMRLERLGHLVLYSWEDRMEEMYIWKRARIITIHIYYSDFQASCNAEAKSVERSCTNVFSL